MPKPIDGRIDASRRIKGDQNQTTGFYFFSPSRISIIFRKKSLLFYTLDDGRAVGNEFGADHDFADHHLGNAPASRRRRKAFIAYWTDILINRVHHGAGHTAR
jgi:hypothetical protein